MFTYLGIQPQFVERIFIFQAMKELIRFLFAPLSSSKRRSKNATINPQINVLIVVKYYSPRYLAMHLSIATFYLPLVSTCLVCIPVSCETFLS